MMTLVIVLHLIVCVSLVVAVLIQSGRGGGLVSGFSGIESMFGTKTNAFLTRATNILSVLFFVTCLSLAFLSLRQSRSLMKNYKNQGPAFNQTEAAPAQAQHIAPQQDAKAGIAAPKINATETQPALPKVQ